MSVKSCNICIQIFPNIGDLREHQNAEHRKEEGNLQCQHCTRTFSNKYYLQIHTNRIHVNNPAEGKCDQCEKTFKNQHILKSHKYRCHNREKTIPCGHCNQMFSTEGTRITHTNRTHLKIKNVSCGKCGYKGFSTYDVRTHTINKHSDVKPFQCTLCPRAFKRVSFLYHHRESHSNALKAEKDSPCKTCGKMFQTKLSASRCAESHKTQGHYPCSVDACDKIFSQKSTRRNHVRRTHIGNEDKFPCHLCETSFKGKSNLNRHIVIVHTVMEKCVPCTECPSMFKSEKQMKRHRLSHENKRFPCPFNGCNVVRNLQYSISHHFKTAHGKVDHRLSLEERLWREREMELKTACKICKVPIKAGKCKEYNMRLHLKTHENKTPLPCPIEGCQESIYQVEMKNAFSFILYRVYFEHLENIHNITMYSHTLFMSFRCKICNTYQKVESIKPEIENTKFWNRNGKHWANTLLKHLSEEHQEASSKVKNFKQEWENNFEKGSISIVKREKDSRISGGKRTELNNIANAPCKLCGFQASTPKRKIVKESKDKDWKRKSQLRHYCVQHFSEPLQYFVEEYLSENHCGKCNKEYFFRGNTDKLFHVGYFHGELYPFLKSDADIDLTPYIQKKEVVKVKQEFPCQECGTVFKLKCLLKTHLVYHSDERPFSCPQCNAGFKTKSSVKAHEKTHTGEKPYSCDMCKNAFISGTNLKIHKSSQHKRKECPCNECDEIFMTKYDLDVHMEYHYGQKAFKCDQCKMGHSNLRDFTRHKSTHRGKENHICMLCRQSFKDGSNLSKHILLHTIDGP